MKMSRLCIFLLVQLFVNGVALDLTMSSGNCDCAALEKRTSAWGDGMPDGLSPDAHG